MRVVREWTASLVLQVKRRRDPVVVQTLRSAVAATIAYVVALRLSPEPAPLTAPLTALLVVQVTLYATLTNGIRRVNAVVAGVLVAIAFSLLVGLTWWSLALLIVASLVVGRLVRVNEYVPEVAISAMLVLGVTTVGDTAWARIVETLIGAVVGFACNLLLAPPVWVDEAGESIEGLARRVRQLMLRMGEEAAGRTPVERATERLHEARRLDHDIVEVDAALRQAEDSLRLNPRVSEGLLHRVVLRTGLDTLEICTVVLRVLARTFTDLAKEREPERLFAPETGAAVERLLSEIADAVVSFAVLVTSHVSASAESAESRLAAELRQAAATRDKLAQLLLEDVQRDARTWQLYGAVLTEVNRILDEMDTEHRSRRLFEELDRTSREQRERMPRLTRLREGLRDSEMLRVPDVLRRNRGDAARRSK
ncbi:MULTISPECIES: FUSC family protein [unclassified Streptomyces]|uniref:FUSC family protein n=1 Tax=unclassified Streptomyces TaxID=2593676 RepID=UPI002254B476|nr:MULTISPECIES: FUSC family protein [unclassified Streptomyces]MCX5052256.1 aromatic acid exporter family protein [Streptomyces sp. NBC_00474]MCX5064004.1 aromatic acid exporter family protein [Streptomyces sp. NBC_00452]MCX5251425.1 aromatic acid exporter family protein [Streptomyces sp. NBC_00201]MCX5294651.1 aromatic acid exporter family protein [Streptomyces sp. NBC_00183]